MTPDMILAIVLLALFIASVVSGMFLVRMEKRKSWYQRYVDRVWTNDAD